MALILIVKSKCTKWDSSLALVWSRSSENWLVETLQQDGHSSSAVSAEHCSEDTQEVTTRYQHISIGNIDMGHDMRQCPAVLLTQTVTSVDRLHNLLVHSLGLWQPWCRPGARLLLPSVSSWSISGTAANKILHIPNLQTQCWQTISSFNMWLEMRTIVR